MTMPFRRPIPLLDNDVLRTFVAIAETGNFSTAAEAVFRTPSAVSMQIKKLEEQLGATLFLRDARSVTLTQHGELLLTYARNILALSNEAVSRFIMPELSGVVRLGAPEDIGERLLPSILKSFAESYPGIMVDVTIDMSIGLKKRMEEQRLDLALVNFATRPFPTGGEVVYRERLVWAGANAERRIARSRCRSRSGKRAASGVTKRCRNLSATSGPIALPISVAIRWRRGRLWFPIWRLRRYRAPMSATIW